MRAAAALGMLLSFAGCATILCPGPDIVTVDGPSGATVALDGVVVGRAPMQVMVPRKMQTERTITISMDGHFPRAVQLKAVANGWTYANFAFGLLGIPGLLIDAVAGNSMKVPSGTVVSGGLSPVVVASAAPPPQVDAPPPAPPRRTMADRLADGVRFYPRRVDDPSPENPAVIIHRDAHGRETRELVTGPPGAAASRPAEPASAPAAADPGAPPPPAGSPRTEPRRD